MKLIASLLFLILPLVALAVFNPDFENGTTVEWDSVPTGCFQVVDIDQNTGTYSAELNGPCTVGAFIRKVSLSGDAIYAGLFTKHISGAGNLGVVVREGLLVKISWLVNPAQAADWTHIADAYVYGGGFTPSISVTIPAGSIWRIDDVLLVSVD